MNDKTEITPRNVRKWGCVCTKHTVWIASRSSTGIDFGGSTKGSIYSWFTKQAAREGVAKNDLSGTVDMQRFIQLMDIAAKLSKESQTKLDQEIKNSIHS